MFASINRLAVRLVVAALILVAVGFFVTSHTGTSGSSQFHHQQVTQAGDIDAWAHRRSKLGFDEIYVVTAGFHAWRAKGLKAAAERTKLALTFLPQPQWTDEEKKAFHAGDKYETWKLPGSTGCWLGHIHILKHFLYETDQETALLLEDDADWDVDIKTQVVRAQNALRRLTGMITADPWGTAWDVLYLGHCGDRFAKANVVYKDSAVPKISEYDGFHYGTMDGFPPGLRAVHESTRPVCTYGYAVTRSGAEKILELSHDAKAIDTRMGRACKTGEMNCYTINPELIHHHVPAGDAPSEIQAKQHVSLRAWTANILHSARCNANRGDNELISCSTPEVPKS